MPRERVGEWLLWRDAQGAAAAECKTGFMVPLSRKIGPENYARSAARWTASSLAATVLSASSTVLAADKAVVDRLGPTAAAPARAEFSTERAILVLGDGTTLYTRHVVGGQNRYINLLCCDNTLPGATNRKDDGFELLSRSRFQKFNQNNFWRNK